jgi:hypothetical protein
MLEARLSAFDPWQPMGAKCRVCGSRARRSARDRGPGHAFSGPRSRANARRPSPSPRQHRVLAPPPGRPRMGPAPACPNPLPRHHQGVPAGMPPTVPAGWWWRLRSQAPFAVAQPMAWRSSVDAATARLARWSTASVGRRAQVPPPPCRHPAGMRFQTTTTYGTRTVAASATPWVPASSQCWLRSSTVIEGHGRTRCQRVCLASEDETGSDLGLLEGEVAVHAHLAVEQLGAAGAADAGFA